MNGGVRAAACAVPATVGAACAMVPLVDGAHWVAQAAVLLTVQAGAGVLARRVPLPRPLTIAVQALLGLLLLTLVFARDHAWGGLLPGPAAFHEFAQLLRQGGDDIGRYAIPAPATPGIRLMLVGGALLAGLVVDALAATYRSAAAAGLPLLALYSVGTGLARGGTDWLWFLAAAGGYLLLLLAESHERSARRAPASGGGAEPAVTGGGSLPTGRTGRRIGALALGVALAVPAVLPTIDGGLLAPNGRDGGKDRDGGTISAVNPLVSLRDSLNQPQNRELLRYRTSSEAPQDLYLRIVALDRFDGSTWRASERSVTDVPGRLPTPEGLSPAVRTARVNTSVVAADGYAQDYLPLPYPADWVRAEGRWRYEPEGRTLVGDHGQTTRGLRYQVSSLTAQPTAEQLADAPRPPERLRREYTKVPASLPPVVVDRARQVTAGSRNDYERAVRLQEWFAVGGGFTYDTDVRTGGDSEAVARFLDEKRGFCVHFSFAMAAMARTLDIPARVAVGFTPGDPQGDGSMSVGNKDAHAWPELYFEGTGWTRFEPTPSRGSRPAYTVEQPSSGGAPNAPLPTPGRSATPRPAPSAGDTCTGPSRDGCPDDPARPAAGAAPLDTPSSGSDAPAVALAAAGALALVLLLTPPLWRLRVRARRLGGAAPRTPQEAVERTLAAWRELTDSAWDYGIPPDAARTPRGAVAHIVRAGDLDPAAASAAGRVAEAVEQVLYAPEPAAAGAPPTAEVALVRSGLRAAAGRSVRLRAVLAPRSAAGLLRGVWGRCAGLVKR
ncbi:DUF3488 and transglutaminase-like domain-containing protein [Streptomyces sp. I05A-00742]|uniref:transglutaminase family protein n=1 Tax=Streptomyces sp. I05A-00742 TaxID=2732853 RepID=UPI00148916E4|nr:DUF3488 and transglutaminase-like domain-containing protein [Streptomyces sp. I05A-00742]